MVVDLRDPNRPRFTLQELRDVLQERNKLKSQLLLVQEELQCYKRWALCPRDPHSLMRYVFVLPFTQPIHPRPTIPGGGGVAGTETEEVHAHLREDRQAARQPAADFRTMV